jgi:hypothetical protein
MRKSFSIVALLVILLLACHPKGLPVITERKTEPLRLQAFIYPPKETVSPDTVLGHRIFTNRCGRCHGLPSPTQLTISGWDKILPVMMPRAGLDNEEALHVRAWIFRSLNPVKP